MTDKEIHLLRHCLGADSKTPGYRNYYAADPSNVSEFDSLIRDGLMQQGATLDGLVFFHATSLGKKLLGIKEGK